MLHNDFRIETGAILNQLIFIRIFDNISKWQYMIGIDRFRGFWDFVLGISEQYLY